MLKKITPHPYRSRAFSSSQKGLSALTAGGSFRSSPRGCWGTLEKTGRHIKEKKQQLMKGNEKMGVFPTTRDFAIMASSGCNSKRSLASRKKTREKRLKLLWAKKGKLGKLLSWKKKKRKGLKPDPEPSIRG